MNAPACAGRHRPLTGLTGGPSDHQCHQCPTSTGSALVVSVLTCTIFIDIARSKIQAVLVTKTAVAVANNVAMIVAQWMAPCFTWLMQRTISMHCPNQRFVLFILISCRTKKIAEFFFFLLPFPGVLIVFADMHANRVVHVVHQRIRRSCRRI